MFTITRVKGESGEIKTIHADSPERAYQLYSIAAQFDSKPKIYLGDKEIEFSRLTDMIKSKRDKLEKERREIEAKHLLELAKSEKNRQAIQDQLMTENRLESKLNNKDYIKKFRNRKNTHKAVRKETRGKS